MGLVLHRRREERRHRRLSPEDASACDAKGVRALDPASGRGGRRRREYRRRAGTASTPGAASCGGRASGRTRSRSLACVHRTGLAWQDRLVIVRHNRWVLAAMALTGAVLAAGASRTPAARAAEAAPT